MDELESFQSGLKILEGLLGCDMCVGEVFSVVSEITDSSRSLNDCEGRGICGGGWSECGFCCVFSG